MTTEGSTLVRFWKDNRKDGEYALDLSDLREGFFAWAEEQGGMLFPLVRQVGAYLAQRSDGRDTWEPEDTERVYRSIMDDPRHRDEWRWRKQ